MKYLLLIHTPAPDSAVPRPAGGPTVEEFMAFHKTIVDAGVVLESNALDVAHATSLEVRPDGERVVTDGPFAETREMVIFASHDLLKDAPFSRLDMVSCRNLFIYLDRDYAAKDTARYPWLAES